jgi:hypothetical protein
MTDWPRVVRALIRIYRPIALWGLGLMALGIAAGTTVADSVGHLQISLWLIVAGTGAKYWLAVIGVLVISLSLKTFVANGVTRRAFLTGATVFGLGLALIVTLLAPIGHLIEWSLISLFTEVPARYPEFTMSAAASEFGHLLPGNLAMIVSGAAVTAGYYRFGGLGGLLAMIPGLLPMAVAEGLFTFDDQGTTITTRFLPYAAALLLSLAVSVLGAMLLRREIRDVAIRRTTG